MVSFECCGNGRDSGGSGEFYYIQSIYTVFRTSFIMEQDLLLVSFITIFHLPIYL